MTKLDETLRASSGEDVVADLDHFVGRRAATTVVARAAHPDISDTFGTRTPR